jgi:UDP-N-acetylmuramyl pentapeptide phosphotransferase/UDP-N-acetylglucosamine-1-phosphate transferase
VQGLVLFLVFAGVTVVSWLSIYAARSLAVRYNVFDIPNERSSHARPTPLGGGGAIVLVTVAAFGLFAAIHPVTTRAHALIFIAGALLIAAVSLVDDLGHVPYPIRLAVQGLAAAVFILGYAYWHAVDVPLLGTIALGGFGIVLTLVWMVGLTNAFNFMDGVDGMAAGQAVVAGLGWAMLGWLKGWSLLELTGLLLAATSLGFLLHNWHPARIFMGDVGSTFLGYCFAALAVIAARYDARLALAGVLLVWPTIFDTGFTALNRLRRHENIFAGHREFLFHRLVATGWTHAQAATLYLTFPMLGALLAFTWDRGTPLLHAGMGLVVGALCLALWLFVRRRERIASTALGVLDMLVDGRPLALVDAPVPLSLRGAPPAVSHAANGRHLRPSPPIGAAPTASGWDGVERRSGRDRRRGIGRRRLAAATPDRRSGWGRRATDRPPSASATTEPSRAEVTYS